MHRLIFLLIVFLESARAQAVCLPPELDHGYFVPEIDKYTNGSEIFYACDQGHKPAMEGWWGMSRCDRGKWLPSPKCIDETACIGPAIANAKLDSPTADGVYQHGSHRFACVEGYESNNQISHIECKNGNWILKPACEKSTRSCGKPLKISNAVIIHDEHREIFPEQSKLRFECKDSYTFDVRKEMTCLNGQWTLSTNRDRPLPLGCTLAEQKKPFSAVPVEDRIQNPQLRNTKVVRPCPLNEGCDAGSSAPDRSSHQESITFTKINECGKLPSVENAVIIRTFETSITYQCNDFYKLRGPTEVMCYGNRSWSTLPTCIDNFCKMPKETKLFIVPREEFVKNQDMIQVPCKKSLASYATSLRAQCIDGEMQYSTCVYWFAWDLPLRYRNKDIIDN